MAAWRVSLASWSLGWDGERQSPQPSYELWSHHGRCECSDDVCQSMAGWQTSGIWLSGGRLELLWLSRAKPKGPMASNGQWNRDSFSMPSKMYTLHCHLWLALWCHCDAIVKILGKKAELAARVWQSGRSCFCTLINLNLPQATGVLQVPGFMQLATCPALALPRLRFKSSAERFICCGGVHDQATQLDMSQVKSRRHGHGSHSRLQCGTVTLMSFEFVMATVQAFGFSSLDCCLTLTVWHTTSWQLLLCHCTGCLPSRIISVSVSVSVRLGDCFEDWKNDSAHARTTRRPMPLVSLGKGTLANQAILKMKLPEKKYIDWLTRLTHSIDYRQNIGIQRQQGQGPTRTTNST